MDSKFLFKIGLIFMIVFGVGCQSRSVITATPLDRMTERFLSQRTIFSADKPFSFQEVKDEFGGAFFEQNVYPYVDEQGNAVTGNDLPELSLEQLEDYFARAWPSYDPIDLVKNDPKTFIQNFTNEEGVSVLNQKDIEGFLPLMDVASQEVDSSFVVPSEHSKTELPAEFSLNDFFPEIPFWGDLLNIGSTSFQDIQGGNWYVSDIALWEDQHYVGEWGPLQIIQDSTNSWPQFIVFTEKESRSKNAHPSDDVFSELRFVLSYDEQGDLQKMVVMDVDEEMPSHDKPLWMYFDFFYDERKTLTRINEWEVLYQSDQLAVPKLTYKSYRYLHD